MILKGPVILDSLADPKSCCVVISESTIFLWTGKSALRAIQSRAAKLANEILRERGISNDMVKVSMIFFQNSKR